jgi:hypothetical protein
VVAKKRLQCGAGDLRAVVRNCAYHQSARDFRPNKTEKAVKDITETAFVVAPPPPAATMLPPWSGAKDEFASLPRTPAQVKVTVPIPRPRPRIAP